MTDNYINAAVLVPVYRDRHNRLRIVFILRSPGGVHGGQLAFPGGKHEVNDDSMLSTALRETHEEIGLGSDQVRIIAELPPVKTMFTGFRIFPFLGAIKPVDWVIDKSEIAEVIDFDLESLAEPAMYGEELMQQDDWPEPRLIAFYRVGDHKLWGASYRIFSPILPKIIGTEWQI